MNPAAAVRAQLGLLSKACWARCGQMPAAMTEAANSPVQVCMMLMTYRRQLQYAWEALPASPDNSVTLE